MLKYFETEYSNEKETATIKNKVAEKNILANIWNKILVINYLW